MSKKILRRVREELESIQTNDIFVADAIKTCIALCNAGLAPRGTLPPHQWHSDTSAAAAVAIAPKFGRMTRSVLTMIARYQDGLTDEEAQSIMGMQGNSYRPCRVTLMDKGFVVDTGHRRKTRQRKDAVVWSVTPEGYLALGEA